MAKATNPIPTGYHSITPSLTCRDAAKAIDFYKIAFEAQEKMRSSTPDGKVSHAEIKIGDSIVFVNDEFPGMTAGPAATKTPSVNLFLYVPDVDAVYERAIAAGAHADMPLEDMFWGDRFGKVTDPFGHQWSLATHVEDVAPEEISRRAAAFFAKAAGQNK
ncbi:MAG: VOC family protein [Candidatus Acidiferrales bacterium]